MRIGDNVYKNYLNLTFDCEYSGVTVYLSGELEFELQKETDSDFIPSAECRGYLNGNLVSDDLIHFVQVGTYCFGKVSLVNLTGSNVSGYYLKSLSGTCVELKTEAELKQKDEIINIYNTNMLGRKLLSEPNPLLGNNLDKRPIRMDAEQRYMKEHWYIEEITINDDLPSGYLINGGGIRPLALNAPLNFNLCWEPERFSTVSPIGAALSEIPQYYALPLTGLSPGATDDYQITGYEITDQISDNLLPVLGPINDFDVCVDLLYLYCHVNNFTIELIMDENSYSKKNKFKIIKN